MTAAALVLGLLLAQGHGAKGKSGARAAARKTPAVETQRAPEKAAAAERSPQKDNGGSNSGGSGSASEGTSTDTGAPAAGGKNVKTKVLTFGAMDVEGKLKTPQLLYFLNRVKLELEMSAPDKRSFMKELQKSADDKNL